jgi:hypothetical protein
MVFTLHDAEYYYVGRRYDCRSALISVVAGRRSLVMIFGLLVVYKRFENVTQKQRRRIASIDTGIQRLLATTTHHQ